MKDHAAGFADLSDFFDWLNGANLVVCKHDGNKASLVINSGFKVVNVNYSVFIHRQIGHAKTLFLFFFKRVQNCVVLKRRCYYVLFVFHRAKLARRTNCPIVTFTTARRKIDFAWIGIDTLSYAIPCIGKPFLCFA